MVMNILAYLEDYLLKQVTFSLDDKIIRRGRLLLFNNDGYYIKFTLQTNKNNKIYEIPYPYSIVRHTDCLKFSYEMSTFCKGNESKIQFLTEVTPKSGVHKLHDKCLTISVIEH